ncbi:MAG: putative lipid II flippase FtsW [Lachnospiraceae bacterium]|nr:putative lipid II flippase FtsW [Lachnospiraceae bacterium]
MPNTNVSRINSRTGRDAVRGRRAGNRRVNREQAERRAFVDYTLVVAVLFLTGFGLVMIYSTSSYEASVQFGDSSYYLRKQMLAAALGIVAMVIVAMLPYHFWERVAFPIYAVSYVLIFLIIPFGHEANGAKRWFRVAGISVQPAEIMKIAVILFTAGLIVRLGGKRLRTGRGFALVLLTGLIPALLIRGITDNMSSAVIVFGISFLMLFVAAPDYKRFALIVGFVAVVALVAVLVVMNTPEGSGAWRLERIRAWMDPASYASGKGFQTLQALYAIGSGGLFGKGLGQSVQKLGFIPEAQNDMIFSIICEELGLVGALAVISMFVIMIWRFMVIADSSSDLYGGMIVVGVMAHVSIQVILNIAVVTNVMPNTGISLPFISYGGSALVCMLMEVGLVLSVGRGIYIQDL